MSDVPNDTDNLLPRFVLVLEAKTPPENRGKRRPASSGMLSAGASEFHQRGATCFSFAHAFLRLYARQQLDGRPDFLRQVALDFVFAAEIAQQACESRKQHALTRRDR
ncbi:MAG: hypothetical protein H0W04_04525 [Chthoniobacterales bacterium]|nr:hypothetical protein [Chthoniobacterales bacterium]